MAPPGRSVTLVLVDGAGQVLGALPPFAVDVPYWQEVGDVVRRARELYAVDIVVLRLLDSEFAEPPGGQVTYLAEFAGPDRSMPTADPWPGVLEPDSRRLPWAEPGGPRAALGWADAELRARDRARLGRAEQMRTWNLSSLWRIPVDAGQVWLKLVPPFFAHEGRVLELLQGEPVPTVIAQDSGRILLDQVDGSDLYAATPAQRERLLDILVDLQARYSSRIDTLLATGMADFRSPALTTGIASVVQRTAPQLPREANIALESFVEDLSARFAQVEMCGLPDTLVHGDYHPGNARGSGVDVVVLDWGDCGVGHPLLDQPAFLDRVEADGRAAVRAGWHQRLQTAFPGSDPDRAASLLEPVAAARQATTYLMFLDNIEASEHPYHRHDPATWLRRTAALLGGPALDVRG